MLLMGRRMAKHFSFLELWNLLFTCPKMNTCDCVKAIRGHKCGVCWWNTLKVTYHSSHIIAFYVYSEDVENHQKYNLTYIVLNTTIPKLYVIKCLFKH